MCTEQEEVEPLAKKTSQQTIILGDEHDEEGLQSTTNTTANEDEMAEGSMKDSGRATKGMDGGRAATGPGATGKLPGATESVRQEP